jgi:hypothetical protein
VLDLNPAYLGSRKLQDRITDVSDTKPLMVSGTGIGMVGDTLIVEYQDHQFMLSLSALMGSSLLFEPDVRDGCQALPQQGALF